MDKDWMVSDDDESHFTDLFCVCALWQIFRSNKLAVYNIILFSIVRYICCVKKTPHSKINSSDTAKVRSIYLLYEVYWALRLINNCITSILNIFYVGTVDGVVIPSMVVEYS
jgi:hypothetical protein